MKVDMGARLAMSGARDYTTCGSGRAQNQWSRDFGCANTPTCVS